ncbi:Protein SON [Aphelenchoides fujianensis]|nr:Protein SON [Aphelenchoides fujianensis]
MQTNSTSETAARPGPASVTISQTPAAQPMNSISTTNDTLRNAPARRGGLGELLLQRMGWQPGQDLGRNKDGPVDALILDVKAGQKGRHSTRDEAAPRLELPPTVNGKPSTRQNPVSVIMEYCAKRGFLPPVFAPIEDGPPNQRRFGCKALLNGVMYDAPTDSTNKKAAKAQVCLIMCQALRIKG